MEERSTEGANATSEYGKTHLQLVRARGGVVLTEVKAETPKGECDKSPKPNVLATQDMGQDHTKSPRIQELANTKKTERVWC